MTAFEAREGGIARAPSGGEIGTDRGFRILAYVAGLATIGLLIYILFIIGEEALPAMRREGVAFLTTAVWRLAGTNSASSRRFGERSIRRLIIEMLAAIPSVVYGLWGIFVVIPSIRPAANWLHDTLGWFPLFGTSMGGPSLAPAVIVLAIMVLPTVAAISQDAFRLIPYKVKEAAYGMGTTKWEAIFHVMIPTAITGIFASLVLGFGRALGETMALAMIIVNANQISLSLFAPANTLAALLASNFPEADQIERGALMYAAVVLLAVTLIVNMLGTLIMTFAGKQQVS